MNKLFMLVLVLLSFTVVSAQDNPSVETKNNELGIHIGATTGIGLSYRHWFDKIGFQLTVLPVKTEQVTFISAGVSALYSFYDSKYVSVFGFLGSHYSVRERDEDIDDIGINRTDRVKESSCNFGIGPGFGFGRTVRFNLMVGYGFYDVFEKFNMFPTGEIGLYYRF
jgi:hypothetical protein